VYYQYALHNSNDWSEWILVNSAEFVLEDNSDIGGSDYDYTFKAVSGSGLAKTSETYYVPIDTNLYSVTAELYVNGIASGEGRNYAIVSGEGDSFRRGDSTVVDVRANAETGLIKNYYLKSISYFNGDESIGFSEWTYDQKLTNVSRSVTIDGSNFKVEVNFYKEIALVYANEKQTLQTGSAVSILATPEEPDFQALYNKEGGALNITIKYKNETEQELEYFERNPQYMDIGFYSVLVETKPQYEDFIIVNPTTTLTLVYFAQAGTEASPYEIKNVKDFGYVDAYMAEGSQNDYLGSNRRKAQFVQLNDIDLGKDFVPLANKFAGIYKGQGFELYYEDTYTTKASFAIFKEVDGGTITNLGVRINHLRAENLAEGSNVALLVANFASGTIEKSYAIGDITASGHKINVGGLVGYAYQGFISNVFVDVALDVASSSGNFGGICGYMKNSITANAYVIGSVVITDSISPAVDSGTLEAGVGIAYAGAVTGQWVAEGYSIPAFNGFTYYLDESVSYDGDAEKALACGNAAPIDQLKYQAWKFNAFSECETLIINVTTMEGESIKTVMVQELALLRIEEAIKDLDVIGNGTQSNPFLVDNVQKLALIETFPWAYFKQTQDITLNANGGFAHNMPFVGEYDGNGYKIEGASLSGSAYGY
ncbi:MAG: hypothetical protein J6V83_00780, partial [Clostridia bacterium]|nr:hypothetical protein [Clostridia bacterium]